MIVNCKNIYKSYPSHGTQKNEVLRDIHLTLNQGESLAIMGPSGSGKTTLLKIIGLLENCDQGSVEINQSPCLEWNPTQKAQFRNENIGFIFQEHLLLPQCTLIENILMPTIIYENKSEAQKEYALKLLSKLGLESKVNSFPSELSGGEKQRGACIRALINNPSLILADEPTGALDHNNALAMTKILIELCEENGVCLLMATHSEEIAKQCHRIRRLHMMELQ